MRHQWYADARDLIKWGALLHIASENEINHIIQVAFLRPDTVRPKLHFGNQLIEIPNVVWSHFRDLNDINRLAKKAGVRISLISTPFEKKRRPEYINAIVKQCRAKKSKAAIIFLDPDTGIFETNAKPEHVASDEVRRIWDALQIGSWLVLYQHSFFNKRWREIRLTNFAKATGLNKTEITSIRAAKGTGATDVVFLCAVKK